MLKQAKLKVAVLFGGRSPEHEVSIITGIQVMHALDKDKYTVIPLYVTKDGQWIKGDESFLLPSTFRNLASVIKNPKKVILSSDPTTPGIIEQSPGISLKPSLRVDKVDVVFPTFHGRYGEDGCVQGLLELSGIPYVGCDVQTSAIGMDKVVSKMVARSIGVPVLPEVWILQHEWQENYKKVLAKIISQISLPAFIKPARLGSSIGISKARTPRELKDALDVAFFYDTKVMVEQSLEQAKEVNLAILGNNPYRVSVTEQPISPREILTFADKYLSQKGASHGMASAQRIIPAPISSSTKSKIETYANKFFASIGGQGLARIDFLVSRNEKQVYFNEINTLPGSVAFYLWQAAGLPFDQLVNQLIELSLDRARSHNRLITTFKSNILSGFSGTKGVKS